MTGEPIDMSLRAPNKERLEMLAEELYGSPMAGVSGQQRAEVYGLALQEMQVSALSVLAQFCAGAR